MINFIKNLLGFGAKETVKEIITPPAVEPKKEWTSVEVKLEPAKPAVQKVRAVTVPATAANTKPKSRPVTEGNTKGGNGAVKQQQKQSNKPKAPGKPKARRK